jgi:hypothetical protein
MQNIALKLENGRRSPDFAAILLLRGVFRQV